MLPLLKIHLPLRNVNGKSKCYEKAFVKSCQSNGWYVKSYSQEKGINDFCLMLNFFFVFSFTVPGGNFDREIYVEGK